jgi:hypothetical protein
MTDVRHFIVTLNGVDLAEHGPPNYPADALTEIIKDGLTVGDWDKVLVELFEWRAMESAPKDGREILVRVEGTHWDSKKPVTWHEVCSWDRSVIGQEWTWTRDDGMPVDAAAWMPIPGANKLNEISDG